MGYHTLTYQKKGNVGVISINGPLNEQEKIALLANELTEACFAISSDDAIRVIILTGNGERPFSVGERFAEEVCKVSEEGRIKFWSLAEPIAKLDRPIIAAINGDAIWQGLELVLACDLRITAETSYFGFPQIGRGFIPWDGGTQRLSRLVGKGKAIEMILSGEIIDAQEAYQIGLVNRVILSAELMAAVLKMAQEMADKGPIALRYAKEAIYKGVDLTLEQGLRLEADLYLLLHTTRDRTEGIEAFRGKRTPRFEGK
jgi:enoyl-CoA hydratase/carnithine racemase